VRRALPADFVAEIEGRDPEARKRRRIEGSHGLEGYEAPDEVHFARGPNAVNPRGREGAAVEAKLLEGAGGGGGPSAGTSAEGPSASANANARGGIFSGDTLARLAQARVAVQARPAAAVSAGPLVAYGSDDDDDE